MDMAHFDGVELEHTVLDIYQKDHSGAFGGFITADHFERDPFLAAVLALAPLYYKNSNENIEKKLGDFLSKWKTIFDYPDENKQYTFEMYSKELEEIISIIKS